MKYEFTVKGEVFEWRGPSPYHFVEIPEAISERIKSESALLSYGWGVIPIHGIAGTTSFTSSLIPRNGIYLIPIKDAIRNKEKIEVNDFLQIKFNLGKLQD